MDKITPTQIYRFLNKKRHDFSLWAGSYEKEITALADHINNQMSFNKYQVESLKTWKRNYNNDFERALFGIAEEAGEVLGKVKKAYRDLKPLDSIRIMVAKELGDLLYYITRVGEYFDLTLEEIAQINIDKLADRQKRGKISGSGDNR